MAATPYPTIDFTRTFSNITVEAKTDNTRNVVETGIPIRVKITKIAGAAA